ncbi:MAG: DinB family protein [Bacteroidota bacterium]
MKQYLPISILFLISFPLLAQDAAYLDDFKKKWSNATDYTLEVMDLMPEDQYDYQPMGDVQSFRELLLHMTQNMIWLSTYYLGDRSFDRDLKDTTYTKAEMVDLVKEAFAFTNAVVDELEPHELKGKVKFFAGPMNVRQILTLMNDHLTHHRGQIIVYLRMHGIKPPRYRGW